MAHTLSKVDGFVKRSGEIFDVDPKSIIVEPGWNDRKNFDGEEELMESIKAVGVQRPLIVKKTKQNTLILRNGERRLRAVTKLNKQGCGIKAVPVVVKTKVNDADLYLESVIADTGKPLEPVEEANSFKRLIAYGYTAKEIAEKVGRSVTHVYKRLDLASAGPDVKKAVNEKEISVKDALEIVDNSDGNIEKEKEDVQKKKTEKQKKKTEKPVYSDNEKKIVDLVKEMNKQMKVIKKNTKQVNGSIDSGALEESLETMIELIQNINKIN